MSGYDTTDAARQRWDERYATEGYVFGVEPNRFLAEYLEELEPGRALDLGSGQGRNAVWLATQGHDVTAVDLSPVATEQAQALAAEAGVDVTFINADVVRWQPEAGSYDLVVLSYLQIPEPDRRSVHASAVRALADGGHCFLIAHHRDNLEQGYGGPPSAEVLYSEEDLAVDFASLNITTLERVLRPVDVDGEEHLAIDVVMMGQKTES